MEKLPTILFLREKNIPFEIKTFSQTTTKGILAISKALGVAPEKVVKTLMFRGKSGMFFCCLVGGKSKVDYKKLKKVTNEKSFRMASPDEILGVTGYSVGAIPPFALKSKLKTFIDTPLRYKSVLYVGAGKFGVELALKPEDLSQITDGDFMEIAKDE